MSEEKYEDKVLKILNQIAEQTKPQKGTDSSEEPQIKHTTAKELASCPNCRPKYKFDEYDQEMKEKTRPEIAKEIKEKLKSKDLVTCNGCGEIVAKEEKECPSCHGTRAH